MLPRACRLSRREECQQAHFDNARPQRWLHSTGRRCTKKPRQSGAEFPRGVAGCRECKESNPHRNTTTETVAQHATPKQTVSQICCKPARTRFPVRSRRLPNPIPPRPVQHGHRSYRTHSRQPPRSRGRTSAGRASVVGAIDRFPVDEFAAPVPVGLALIVGEDHFGWCCGQPLQCAIS